MLSALEALKNLDIYWGVAWTTRALPHQTAAQLVLHFTCSLHSGAPLLELTEQKMTFTNGRWLKPLSSAIRDQFHSGSIVIKLHDSVVV